MASSEHSVPSSALDPALLAGIPVEMEGKEDTTRRPRSSKARFEKVGEESGIVIFELRDRRFLELPLAEEALNQLCAAPQVVIDLRGRELLVTSNGLQNLLNLQKKATLTGTRLVLCNVPASVQDLLPILSVDRFFEIQPGVPEAVASLQRAKPAG